MMMAGPMWYVAKRSGMPGFYAAVFDDPEKFVETATTVANWVKQGVVVLHVSAEEAHKGLAEYFDARADMTDKGHEAVLLVQRCSAGMEGPRL